MIGYILGLFTGVILMCAIQINRITTNEEDE